MGIFNKKINEISIAVPILDGLPISQGEFVKINAKETGVTFRHGINCYELKAEKLLNIHHKTSVEIQKSVGSSIGGAIGGYLLLGPLGAIIGGRSKEQISRTLQLFLIFEYEDERQETKFISFDITHTPKAKKINMEFFNKKVTPKNIQL